MNYKISHPDKIIDGSIYLPGSKSISNRVLIIEALCEKKFQIDNLSDAMDIKILQKALSEKSNKINVGASGTAMRFLTAFLTLRNQEITLIGNKRMHERPIKPLVDALNSLGGNIEYVENEGFPPILIKKSKILGGEVEIDSTISSQFISALLLISPSLEKGIKIYLIGNSVSKPYIKMTLKLMAYFGIIYSWEKNTITIKPQKYKSRNIIIEGDWSAAAFWFEIAHFSKKTNLKISNLHANSIQGDRRLKKLFTSLFCKQKSNELIIKKSANYTTVSKFNLKETPDISPSLIIANSLQKKDIIFNGLETLIIKESNRLEALKCEMLKYGVNAKITHNSLYLCSKLNAVKSPKKSFETYKDHRIAMSIAPLALVFKNIIIKNVNVIDKSYPRFWEDLKKVGFIVSPLNDLSS